MPDTKEPATIYLRQGEFYMSSHPTVVMTTLGSCVSLVLYHPRNHYGGICHAMYPVNNNPDNDRFFYVDSAVREMVDFFIKKGVRKNELVVKLFGGACVLTCRDETDPNPGADNVASALRTLAEYGLRPSVQDTGGRMGRKIVFLTETGVVLVKRLKYEQAQDEIPER